MEHSKTFAFKLGRGSQKITLVKEDNIILNDKEVAETFNKFFLNAVKSLNILQNEYLMTDSGNLADPVEIAMKKIENHPSIIDIKNMIEVDKEFSFSKVKAYKYK